MRAAANGNLLCRWLNRRDDVEHRHRKPSSIPPGTEHRRSGSAAPPRRAAPAVPLAPTAPNCAARSAHASKPLRRAVLLLVALRRLWVLIPIPRGPHPVEVSQERLDIMELWRHNFAPSPSRLHVRVFREP
jgi:hypothetical protein